MFRSSWRSRLAAALVVASSAVGVSAPTSSAAEQWAWPVRGSVITPYSNDNSRPYAGGMHRGIDIAAPAGTRVVAASAGRVTYAGALGSSGLTLAIATADRRYTTSYLHLGRLDVKRGEPVSTGQTLGEVGTTGQRSVAEPHLHFGVRHTAREHFYVDPVTLLPPRAGGRSEPPVASPLPSRARAQYAPVPLGPRTIPATVPRRFAPPATAPRLPVARAPEAPITWGPVVSTAGLLLLGGVLGGRLLRDGRSGAGRGSERAQPSARPATVSASRLGSISQMG